MKAEPREKRLSMNPPKNDTTYSDDQLIKWLTLDEAEAIKAIYHKYWNVLLDFAFSFTRDEAEAKDIVQDVFVRLVVKEHLKAIQSNLKSYLYLSVKRDCIRHLRSKFSSVTLNESFDQFVASTHNEHSAHAIMLKELEFHYERELTHLPPRLKEVFELSRKQGLNSREISLQLGLSHQTVRNQLSQVIRILKRKLQLY